MFAIITMNDQRFHDDKHGMIICVIAFSLPGNIPVYTSSLLIALGVSLGLWWISQQKTYRLANAQVSAGLWFLAGALAGARAVHVIVDWGYFQDHLLEIFQFQLGGLSWPGAIIGAVLGLLLYLRLMNKPFGQISDAMVPLMGLLAISVWLGCWFDGCAYGSMTSAWWGIPSRDEWGLSHPRVPLQLLGATLTIAVFWVLDRFAHRLKLKPGTLFGLTSLGLCLLLLIASLLRADPAPEWKGLRLETYAGFLLTGLALATVAGINFRIIGSWFTQPTRQKGASLPDREPHKDRAL